MREIGKYTPGDIESKWYGHWLENNYFHAEVSEKEPYTIVIPPPNVTGKLHMGHMLNNTIQGGRFLHRCSGYSRGQTYGSNLRSAHASGL